MPRALPDSTPSRSRVQSLYCMPNWPKVVMPPGPCAAERTPGVHALAWPAYSAPVRSETNLTVKACAGHPRKRRTVTGPGNST